MAFINSKYHDYSAVEAMVNGKPILLGIESISYSHRLEPTKVRGTRARPLGRTLGEYDAEASITVYKRDAEILLKELGPGYMEREFQLAVSYAKLGAGTPMQLDVLKGCRIMSEEDSHSQGTDALRTTFELSVMAVVKNGREPLISSR